MAVACLALFVALGGSAYAVTKISGANIIDRSIAGVKLKRDTVRGAEINERSLALPGKATVLFQQRRGPLPLRGPFTSSGRPLLITASGSAYSSVAGDPISVIIAIDGVPRGQLRAQTSRDETHTLIGTSTLAVTGLAAGRHTLSLRGSGGLTNADDVFSVTIHELPHRLVLGPDENEQDDTRSTESMRCHDRDVHGTIAPAGDDDWVAFYCAHADIEQTWKFSVVGGPRIDVYLWEQPAPLARNVKTFTHVSPAGSSEFFEVRIHSGSYAAYTMTVDVTLRFD